MIGAGGIFSAPIKLIAIALIVSVLIVSAFVALDKWEKNKGHFPEHEENNSFLEYNGKDYVLRDNIETFLVLGLDKFEGSQSLDSYNNDQQADFLMLFVFDNSAKTCTAIHVNRDTMAKVNVLGVAGNKVGTVTKQIALAHTYGNGKDVSCHNTADAVSELLLGVRINHYISLKMDAVAIFNDLLGGVELEVLDDFTGIDDTLVKGQTVTLLGEHALTYVRTRAGLEDSTNSTRMKRQQQYIGALYNKFQSVVSSDPNFIVDASLKMGEHIVSDRSITQLQTLSNKFAEYDFLGIKNIDGESKMGQVYVEFYADEAALKKMVAEMFCETAKQEK